MNTTAVVVAVTTVACYLATVRHRRFARVRAFAREHGYEGLSKDELYEKMTLRDAEKVNLYFARYEFPKVYKVALQFALFQVRTYPPPTSDRGV